MWRCRWNCPRTSRRDRAEDRRSHRASPRAQGSHRPVRQWHDRRMSAHRGAVAGARSGEEDGKSHSAELSLRRGQQDGEAETCRHGKPGEPQARRVDAAATRERTSAKSHRDVVGKRPDVPSAAVRLCLEHTPGRVPGAIGQPDRSCPRGLHIRVERLVGRSAPIRS